MAGENFSRRNETIMHEKQSFGGNFSRRRFLKYGLYGGLAVSLASSLWLGGCGISLFRKKPNVILISIDTLRADHLGCYGYSRPTSPVLDKFASEGVLFEDVSATSPWTLPSHGSLLTGLYPNLNGLRSHRDCLANGVLTMAEVFSKSGFLTAAIVNSMNLGRKFGLDRGFNHFTYVKENVGQVEPSEVETEAFEWLSKHGNKPFFLFLHYYDVHSDYRSLPRYEKEFIRPYNGIADGSTAQLRRHRRRQFSLNQVDAEHLIDLYDASIRQMDDGLGRLFDLLETHRLLDHTFIVITSDHGEEFLEHGDVLHGRTYFQEVIQVPLLLRGPDIPKSKRIKHMASLVDVMPTILSLLDIPKPTSLDGIDLAPLWQDSDSEPPRRFIFAEADHNTVIQNKMVNDIKRMVRHPRYKFHYDRVTMEKQLYDLSNDPKEKVNVAREHSAIADLLFLQLQNFTSVTNTGQPAPPLSPEEMNRLKSLGYL
jgi:arylsulfatase A-like enzyme